MVGMWDTAICPSDVLAVGLAVTFLLVLYRRSQWLRRSGGAPLPPGPKGYPIIGNVLEVSTHFAWLNYEKWVKKYGDLVYFEVFAQPFLLVGSLKRATDLLEKRSSNYSDRLHTTMMMDLMGWDYNFGLQAYGPRWRQHRKLFHEHFQPTSVGKYHDIQIEEARAMTLSILRTPDALASHIRQMFAQTVMRMVYGMGKAELAEDGFMEIAEFANQGFIAAGMPGTFLVDIIPALKHVPAWFPGAGFHRKAAAWKDATDKMRIIPFERVMNQMNQGGAGPSISAELIAGLPPREDPAYEELKTIAEGVAGVSFAGEIHLYLGVVAWTETSILSTLAGADTTLVAVRAFFLAVTMHPEVVKKAQEELDAVVGPHRLPNFSDEPSLPYVKAICMELTRWHQVLPLGIPHLSSKDDVYDGYFIPKGTLVIANAWSILHDPEVFEDPFSFKPERYLDVSGTGNDQPMDPSDCGFFGFGRRICPGRHFSSNSLFAIVSTFLSVLDISAPLDENGQPKLPKYDVFDRASGRSGTFRLRYSSAKQAKGRADLLL